MRFKIIDINNKYIISKHVDKYLPFDEAREYVRKLKLKNQKEWREFKKSGNLPRNIPLTPERTYKNFGWVSGGDWIGTGYGTFCTFEEGRKFAIKLQLKNVAAWNKYVKSGNKPSYIPSGPHNVYKHNGWVSYRDWLGFSFKGSSSKEFLEFNEARKFVRKLGLKTAEEWAKYSLSDDKPYYIPSSPINVYKNKGWSGYGDWLGTGAISTRDIEFLTFDEAKKYTSCLKLKSRKEWRNYVNTGKKPKNIPSAPELTYGKSIFTSYADWLGYECLPFEEARKFVRTLGLKDTKDWLLYIKSMKKPDNIPNTPSEVYKYDGWCGLNDWIGNDNTFIKNKIIYNFLISIESQLQNLDLTDLVVIIQQAEGGYFYEKISKNIHFRNILASKTEEDRINAIQDLKTDYSTEEYTEGEVSVLDSSTIGIDNITDSNIPMETDILKLTNHTIKQIQSLDVCPITASLDEEVIEFFNKKNINELWNKYMNRELDLEVYSNSCGGEFYENIKSQFLEEHNYLNNWNWQGEIINDIYKSNKTPNLMQRLFVKRVKENQDYGNWSGTGAGKTIGTILATKILNCKNVIIITGNSIIDTWVKEINDCFSNNNILIKDKNPILKKNTTNYLIYNYEFFSQPESENTFLKILEDNVIDFIALDEVQFTKQRELDSVSKRKQLILKLLSFAKQKNPKVFKVAMSATPVVNNLIEAKTLLELLKLVEYDDLDTKETINNAIQIYKQLVINGIRYKPKYDIVINEIYPNVNGEELVERLSKVTKGQILDIENVLLDLKLESIKHYLKKGTIIYSQYVEDMISPIKHFCELNGYKVGIFTGDEKSGLESFQKRKCDILIGSSAIGTGVDGLQNICNNLIILSLPWTHAGYLQLLGRIYRQGSKFGSINVIIPQINIQLDYENWSWDIIRKDRIDSKKELSDCAVDGVIPSDKIVSRKALLDRSIKALVDWKNRIENNEMLSIDRREILFNFSKPEIRKKFKRILGDFSELNRVWSISNSKTMKQKLEKDDSEWFYYHSLYKESRKDWPEIPYIELSKRIKNRPDWVIGDFGCGENLLTREITNKVYAFDYIAIDENVIACDMSKIPLVDSVLDVAIFSLSLMGNNYIDYLKEAYRTLKSYGNLFICEPAKKWENKENELKEIIENVGFRCFGAIRNSDKFIYIDGIKY